MASKNIIEINDSNFYQVIGVSGFVIVQFTATWSNLCEKLAPIMDEIADDFQGQLKVCKLDIDDNPETPEHYGIRVVPTVIVFENGQKKGEVLGVKPRESYTRLVGFY